MLPKIDVPIYELELISTGEKIKFRPFTVKEEKLFLMAAESKDSKGVIDVTKQVINNCVISEIDVENLPIFDIENIFLNLRSKSVGEIVTLKYRCNNTVFDKEKEEKTCNSLVQIDLNLNEIKPTLFPNHSKKIEISDTIGVVMRYPNMNTIEKYDQTKEIDSTLEIIVSCIDFIYDKESIYYTKDTPKEEITEFIDSLQSKDLQKLKNFFETLPKLEKELLFKCHNCNYEEKIKLEGIESFFV